MISEKQHETAESARVQGMDGFTHHFAAVNGVRLHYVKGGSGPVIVLLHGWPYTWLEWRRLMPLLADRFTVIVPDLRGCGDSEKTAAGYEKENVARDLHELLKHLNIDSIDLFGTDIGMMVAFAYANLYQRSVRHLILAESLVPGFGLEELMNPATGGYWHFGFHMQAKLAATLTEGKEAAYLTPMWKLFSAVRGTDEALTSQLLASYMAPGGMLGGFQHYAALLQDGKDNRASFKGKLSMPVLVLNGDRGIPQKQTAECVRQVAAAPMVELVPEAGHALAEENPTWLAQRLKTFLQASA